MFGALIKRGLKQQMFQRKPTKLVTRKEKANDEPQSDISPEKRIEGAFNVLKLGGAVKVAKLENPPSKKTGFLGRINNRVAISG